MRSPLRNNEGPGLPSLARAFHNAPGVNMPKSSLIHVAMATALALPMAAGAVTLVGLTSANELAIIDVGNIAGATRTAITGLADGDRFVGIDLRPGDNLLYGVTLSNQIYTVNALTGAASFVSALSAPIIDPMLAYGVDFNPAADFAGGASLRLVSSAGNNFAINALTGAVGNAANNIGGGITGVAYSNSMPNPSMAPASTELYYIDTATDTLRVATTAFNSPTITTIGALGVDALNANGFDLLPGGMGYAALNVDAGSSLTTGIYSIDITSGAATLLGTYNGTLSGLTVAAIPEPGTYGMMAAGLLAVGALARRRRPA